MQCLAALYRLGERVEVSAGRGQHRETAQVGLGHLDCATCDEHEERGCSLPGEERPPVDDAHRIDSTGDPEKDFIRCCPAGLRVREPILAQAVAELALWGPGGGLAYLGQTPATLPPRLPWLWAAYQAAASRFEAHCARAQTRVSREATERELEARGFKNG